jgi:hypothetical protein
MGSSEERLQKIAAGPQWNTEALDKVEAALQQFIDAFETAKRNPGWEGSSADAAVEVFTKLSNEAHENIGVIGRLRGHLRDANQAIVDAGDATGTLPEGSIDPRIKAAVVGGASIVMPGFGTVASVGALSAIENAMSGGRENEAKRALDKFGHQTRAAATDVDNSRRELVISGYAVDDDRQSQTGPTPGESPSSGGPTGGVGGKGGPRGVGAGPDFPGGVPGGIGGGPGGSGTGPGTGPGVTVPGGHPPIVDVPGGGTGHLPPTYPRPSVDGGIDGGVVGGPGGGGGGAQLGGLPGGAGGTSGAGAANMGGAGLLGGAGGGAAMLAGARMASGGAGGLGGGLLGAKAGMGGAGVGGASGPGASGAGGATNAGARGGTGVMGGGGARPGDEEEKERRGLGLFAPKLEDDDAAPAVPNAARAGSRPPKGAGS